MDYRHLNHFELKQICCFLTLVQAGNNYRSTQDSQLTRQAVAIWRDDHTSIVLRQFLALIKKEMN